MGEWMGCHLVEQMNRQDYNVISMEVIFTFMASSYFFPVVSNSLRVGIPKNSKVFPVNLIYTVILNFPWFPAQNSNCYHKVGVK